jgi:MFS family permease
MHGGVTDGARVAEASHLRGASRLGALRLPAFRYLLGAGMAMQLGGWVQRIAMLWLVFELTGSAIQLAGLAFVSGIFVLVVSPFTGPLADTFGARRMLMAAALGQAAGALVVALAVFTGRESLPLLYAVTVVHGLGQAVNQPMRNLLVYEAVGRELLRNGLALNSITGNLMRVVGPSFGGVLVALRGADLAFGVQAVMLASAVLLVGRLRIEASRSAVRASVWSELGSAVEHLRENRLVLTNVFMALLASTLVYPYVQFMPVFVGDRLGGGAQELGIMQSAIGAGSLIGLWYVVAGRGGMSTMLWGGFVYMALVGTFAQFTSMPVAFGVLLVAGIAHSIFSTLNQALVQLNAGEEYRARVMGLYAMSSGVEPFSVMLLGVLVHAFGIANALAGYSGLAALITLALAVRATAHALRRRRAEPTDEA